MKKEFNITQKILGDIRAGKLTMRPQFYATAKRASFNILFVVVWVFAGYFASLTLFKFQLYDPFGYLSFGQVGWRAFNEAVPWKILGIWAGILIPCVLMLRKAEWVYRRSVASIALMVVVFLAGSATLIEATGVHEDIWNRHGIPFLYHGHFIGNYWVMGKVTAIDKEARTMRVRTPNDEAAKVVWNNDTEFPQGLDFGIGDTVQVVGDSRSGVFSAEGIVLAERAK